MTEVFYVHLNVCAQEFQFLPHWNVAAATGKERATSNLALFAKLSRQTANKVLRELSLILIETSP